MSFRPNASNITRWDFESSGLTSDFPIAYIRTI
jgi:hypothetical protein